MGIRLNKNINKEKKIVLYCSLVLDFYLPFLVHSYDFSMVLYIRICGYEIFHKINLVAMEACFCNGKKNRCN